jgi:hypothetical protein
LPHKTQAPRKTLEAYIRLAMQMASHHLLPRKTQAPRKTLEAYVRHAMQMASHHLP